MALSFTIEPGQKVALVGESGGGKSTISNLLMNQKSRRRCDQYRRTPLGTVKQADVRAGIATVFQDATLFSGTIRENIAYGKPDASDKEIMRAAKAANADGFIGKFEKGLENRSASVVSSSSGGHSSVSRSPGAILKDAPILILDEAMSSLDSRAEHEVQTALDRLMEGRTTLIIAHRLSTIAGVDEIVTLKDGHVDEIGTPTELAKTDGIYAQLLKLQLVTSEEARQRLAAFPYRELRLSTC